MQRVNHNQFTESPCQLSRVPGNNLEAGGGGPEATSYMVSCKTFFPQNRIFKKLRSVLSVFPLMQQIQHQLSNRGLHLDATILHEVLHDDKIITALGWSTMLIAATIKGLQIIFQYHLIACKMVHFKFSLSLHLLYYRYIHCLNIHGNSPLTPPTG